MAIRLLLAELGHLNATQERHSQVSVIEIWVNRPVGVAYIRCGASVLLKVWK